MIARLPCLLYVDTSRKAQVAFIFTNPPSWAGCCCFVFSRGKQEVALPIFLNLIRSSHDTLLFFPLHVYEFECCVLCTIFFFSHPTMCSALFMQSSHVSCAALVDSWTSRTGCLLEGLPVPLCCFLFFRPVLLRFPAVLPVPACSGGTARIVYFALFSYFLIFLYRLPLTSKKNNHLVCHIDHARRAKHYRFSLTSKMLIFYCMPCYISLSIIITFLQRQTHQPRTISILLPFWPLNKEHSYHGN